MKKKSEYMFKQIGKVILVSTIIFFGIILIFSNVQNIYAKTDDGIGEVGIECVGNYSTWKDLDNLNAPLTIAKDLSAAFQKGKAKSWSVKYCFTDNSVDEKDFKGKSLGGNDHLWADGVDLLFYSGHGVTPNHYGANDYSLALNTNRNSKYARRKDMYLGNGDLEWFITFTCNFLKGSMDDIGHMARGIHCICGYSTVVYLYAGMGEMMARRLKSNFSVISAFRTTAEDVQPWHRHGTAVVFVAKNCIEDRLNGYGGKAASDPKPYYKSKGDYLRFYYNY